MFLFDLQRCKDKKSHSPVIKGWAYLEFYMIFNAALGGQKSAAPNREPIRARKPIFTKKRALIISRLFLATPSFSFSYT